MLTLSNILIRIMSAPSAEKVFRFAQRYISTLYTCTGHVKSEFGSDNVVGVEQDKNDYDGCDDQVENGVNEGDDKYKIVDKEKTIQEKNNDEKKANVSEDEKEAKISTKTSRKDYKNIAKRKAWKEIYAPRLNNFKALKGYNDTIYKETMIKWFDNVKFGLNASMCYQFQICEEVESERNVYEQVGSCVFKFGIDVPLNDRKFVHTLVRAQQSAHHKPEVTVRNIYSNAVELVLTYKHNAEDRVLRSVISFTTIDVIGDTLVKLNTCMIDDRLVKDFTTEVCFRTYLSECTFSWSKAYYPFGLLYCIAAHKCPCCDFCVISDSQKRQKSRWQQLYKHIKSSESPNKNVYNFYDDQNTEPDHDVLLKFYQTVKECFDHGVWVLKLCHKVEDKLNCIDSETMKKIEQKVLSTKFNAVQQFTIPIQCAGIYKYGSIVCSQAFQNYIHFIDGVCQQQINDENLREFKDQKKYIRELMREHLSKSLANIYTGGMGQQYNAIPGEASLDKDVKYYSILHSEVIGYSNIM